MSRTVFGAQFGAPFATVRGWEEDGKLPRAPMMNAIVASGIVELGDWFLPAECPRCSRESDAIDDCRARDCPIAVRAERAA